MEGAVAWRFAQDSGARVFVAGMNEMLEDAPGPGLRIERHGLVRRRSGAGCGDRVRDSEATAFGWNCG